MCGILGIISKEAIKQTAIEAAFNTLSHRGSDCYGFSDGKNIFISQEKKEITTKLKQINSADNNNNIVLLHCLHSIVGSLTQPLQTDNAIFLANCEIYNWQQLAKKYKINAKNDADLLLQFLELKTANINNLINNNAEQLASAIIAAEQELDGDYAYAFISGNYTILSRDSIGVKPLSYFHDEEKKQFLFSSEAKVIARMVKSAENDGIKLLEPTRLLLYDHLSQKETLSQKDFQTFLLSYKKELSHSKESIKKQLAELLFYSVEKRIIELKQLPKENRKLAILFSGGVDSSVIAVIADKINQKEKLGLQIILYTAAFSDGNTRIAPDLEAAEEIAKYYHFQLSVTNVSLEETEKVIPEIIKIIEADDPIRVGVALPFYFCSRQANIDGCKVILSGLGSEELFAGYQRHADVLEQKGSTEKAYAAVNQECIEGLKKIWERDLYRDDLLTMHFGLELRLPFLDKKLIAYAMQIPAELKINKQQKKIILREAAVSLGLPEQFAQRKKVAAQYGSNFDKALEKLARKYSLSKAEYLQSIS
ncbi:asparagine synthetase B [Candidatus Woesearchaeota archaeon]|nr:asparagine synthetase B [Candidatus Woesearchaeota archaeon]